MLKDVYDLEVTCSSDAALQAYLAGIDASLRFDQPAISEFEAALGHDAEFALAHAALGRQLFIHGRSGDADKSFALALSLKKRVTRRERHAIDVIVAAASSKPGALQMARSHTETYPNDVYILAHLLGPFGMLAFSGNDDWCAQNVALLNVTKTHFRDDDWWHMTTRGFFAAEQGRLVQGRKDCETAWLLSKNGNCAHSLAHLHYECAVPGEGQSFIETWLKKYGKDSNMRHHLVWHRVLLEIEQGVDLERLLPLYESELDPAVCESTPLEIFCDNASFVWRCHLSDVSIPASIRAALCDYAEEFFGFGGFPFADVHRVMATVLHNDPQKFEQLLQQLTELCTESSTDAGRSVLEYAKGFHAFANGNYVESVSLLEPVLADSMLLGGSNPQRQVIAETFLEACIRAGAHDKARAALIRRNRVPSARDERLLERIRVH